MTDDTETKPWDHGADYYSTSDQDERLSHEDLDTCLEEYLEWRDGTIEDAVAGGVTVHAWAHKTFDAVAEADTQADYMIERLADVISEEHGGPDDECEKVFGSDMEAKFKAAILPALIELLGTMEPSRCDPVGERTFTADELLAWVKQHNPEWLEGKS